MKNKYFIFFLGFICLIGFFFFSQQSQEKESSFSLLKQSTAATLSFLEEEENISPADFSYVMDLMVTTEWETIAKESLPALGSAVFSMDFSTIGADFTLLENKTLLRLGEEYFVSSMDLFFNFIYYFEIPFKTLPQGNLQEITDPAELEQLWNNYFYDGVASLGNGEFDFTKKEGEMASFIQYALTRMIRGGELPPLSLVTGYMVYDPPSLALVEEKLNELFVSPPAISQQELNDVFQWFFLYDKLANTIGFYDNYTTYPEENPWSTRFSHVYRLDNNDVLAILAQYSTTNKDRIRALQVYHLKPNETGGLSFQSGTHVPIITPGLNQVSGSVSKLSAASLNLTKDQFSTSSIHGTAYGDHLLLQSQWMGEDAFLYSSYLLFEPQTQKVLTSISCPQAENYGLRLLPSGLLMKQKDSFFLLNENLEKLPDSQVSLSALPLVLEENPWMFSYDVSQNLNTIAYTDEEGLKLYHRETKTSTLLFSHLESSPERTYPSYIYAPHFLPNDSILVASLTGYEDRYGILLYNMQTGETTIRQDMLSAPSIDWTTISYTAPELKESQETLFLTSLEKNQITPSSFQEVSFGEKPVIFPSSVPFQEYPIYNDNYLAYVGIAPQETTTLEDILYSIVLVNRKTGQAQSVATVKAALPSLLAISKTGEIIFSYAYEYDFQIYRTKKIEETPMSP